MSQFGSRNAAQKKAARVSAINRAKRAQLNREREARLDRYERECTCGRGRQPAHLDTCAVWR